MKRRVLVVGSGPAGSLAAFLCARRGDDVLLIDRMQFPRDKACGDVIGPRALAVLAGVGIRCESGSGVVGEMDVAVAGHEMRLSTRPGVGIMGYGLAARRREFDAELYSHALRVGVQPLQGMVNEVVVGARGVGVSGDFGTLEGDYLVGADGANSTVAAHLGFVDPGRVQFGFALRRYGLSEIEHPLVVLLPRVGELGLPGYGWVFPQGEGAVNMGVGVAVGARRKSAKGLRSALDTFSSSLERDYGIVVRESGNELGGWLKMGMVGTLSGQGRALLVGDAAGVVNPFQGEGIASALESAVLASTSFRQAPLDPGAWYRRAMWLRMGKFQSAGYVVQRFALKSPRVSGLLLDGIVRAGARSGAVAAGWGTFWNDLTDVAGPGEGVRVAGSLVWGGWQVARRSREVSEFQAQVRYGTMGAPTRSRVVT